MARTYILFLIILGHFRDSVTEVVYLNPYTKQSYSGCQEGFIDGLDRYIYNGTLNTTSQDLNIRQIVRFQMQTSSLTGYNTVCQVSIYPNCDNTDKMDACYCRNLQHSKVELILNLTATMIFSNGTLRIEWPQIFSSSDISNEHPIPITYAQPVATLKVDNVTVSLDECNIQLTAATHWIEWCVTGLISPILTLNISATTLQSQSECIRYTYTNSSSERNPINLSVSYLELDGCRRTNRTYCFLNSHIGDSVTEVVHLNPYTKQSYSGCQEKFIDGLDRYIYNGTLDTTSQDLSRRQIVYFEMQTSSLTGYYIVCQVSIYPNCDNTDTLGACYCRNVQHSKVELILNLTATMRFSNGTLRIQWPQFGSSSDISNEELIPITYAQPVATLKVDNVHVSLDTCDFQLTTTHLIEWCVTGLHSYILTLNVSSTGLRSHNECIKFTYTFSSSECSPINLSVSYLELDGRRRANRKSCFLDIPVEEMQ